MSVTNSHAPPCTAVIAFTYFDGPTEGVGWEQSGSSIYFKMVAWDDEQWQRVFVVVDLPPPTADNLRTALAKYETPRRPIWVPNAQNASKEIDHVVSGFRRNAQKAIQNSTCVLVVESRDLVSNTSRSVSLTATETTRALGYALDDRVLNLRSQDILDDFLASLHG